MDYSRELRYKENFIFPQSMDLITESNSKMFKGYYKKLEKGAILLVKNLNNKEFNYSFSLKFSGIRRFLFLEFTSEFFQFLDDDKSGTLFKNKFVKDKVLFKRVLRIGNIKFYLWEKLLEGRILENE